MIRHDVITVYLSFSSRNQCQKTHGKNARKSISVTKPAGNELNVRRKRPEYAKDIRYELIHNNSVRALERQGIFEEKIHYKLSMTVDESKTDVIIFDRKLKKKKKKEILSKFVLFFIASINVFSKQRTYHT